MNIREVELGSIIVEDRGRQDFKDIAELALSIKQYGLINPLLVEIAEDKTIRLLAGERRLKACKILNWKTVPVTTRDSLTDLERSCLELEENLRRAALT